MPITPRFCLTQTHTHVQLAIRVPHVRVTAESIQVVVVDENHHSNDDSTDSATATTSTTTSSTLHFSSPPYLLVLHFAPHRFHETAAEACASYEPTIENGTIQLSLRKEKPGEWENLDLLGQWMHQSQPSSKGARWLKEVIATSPNNDSTDAMKDNDDDDDENQETSSPEMTLNGYGFLRQYHGIYADLTRDGLAKEMLEMPWTEEDEAALMMPAAEMEQHFEHQEMGGSVVHRQRRQLRMTMENDKFDTNRYLQDLDISDDYVYQCAMDFRPHWQPDNDDNDDALTNQLSSMTLNQTTKDDRNNKEDDESSFFFTAEERLQLAAIPYPILPPVAQTHSLHVQRRLIAGLVDILFAYVYDHLTTMGDPTVESAWTVSTLSATLSWMDDWLDDNDSDDNDIEGNTSIPSIFEVVGRSCLRRSLIYPYLRNFDFGCHCLEQVHQILARGVRCIIRCLLQVRAILDHSELYYLGNKVWIDPYLSWLQRDTKIIESVLKVQSQKFPAWIWTKAQLELDLVDLEAQFSRQNGTDHLDEDESGSDEESSDASSDQNQSSSTTSENGEADPSISADLLDNSFGQSILNVAAAKSKESVNNSMSSIANEQRRILIDEVE